MKKVLVTGSRGFVGQRLIETFARHGGFEVIQAINYGDSFEILNSNESLEHSLERVDYIIYLAGRAHRAGELNASFSEVYEKDNVDLAVGLAKKAQQAGVRQFVFLSSIGVTGDNSLGGRIDEKSGINVSSPYTASKYKAEEELKRLMSSGSMHYTIIRPPLIYGKGVTANFLSLLNISLSRLPLPFGRATGKKNFLYAGNLACFLLFVLGNGQALDKTFVLADRESVSTRDLVSLIRRKMNRPALVFPCPKFLLFLLLAILGKGKIYRQLFLPLEIDSSKASSLPGWNQPFTIDQGLDDVIGR